jgi:hypothetical protein
MEPVHVQLCFLFQWDGFYAIILNTRGIYISACQAGGVGKALTVHASTCLQLPPQLLSTMRLSNRQTRSK